MENITQEQFSTILNCKEDIYNLDIQTMEWYKIYNEIINFYKDNNKFELYDYNNVFYFLNIFINWAKIKIDNEINKYNNIQISKDCVIKMLINVGLNLTNICSKTIIYEYYNQNYKVFKEFNIKNFNNIKNTTIFLEKYPVCLEDCVLKLNT